MRTNAKTQWLVSIVMIVSLLIMSWPVISVEAEGPATADPADFKFDPRIVERMEAGETPFIAVSYHDVSNEFAPFMKRGVERAAAEFDVDAVLVGPVSPKAEVQIAELESLVEKGVDGLAISSVSTGALAPVINRFIEQGIPVVTFNTDNPEGDRLAFAGQDLIQSGYEAADYLAQLLGGKGDVIIVSVDAAGQWSIDRETGARNALANYPDINVVQTVNAGTEPQEMYANVENALLANPNVVGVVSLDCCTVQSAAEYVKRNNLKDQILMVGFDEVPAAMQLIKEGYIAATFSQAPERQTYESVKMLLDFLHGEPISTVDTGIARIDLTNVDEYMAGPASEEAAKTEQVVDPADFKFDPRIVERMEAGETPFIAVSYHDVSNEFAPFMKRGVERAAAEFDVDAVLVGPVSPKAEVQIAELESLVEKGVDGLAISSVSTGALAPVINRFIEQGIPVVTFNTDNPEGDRLAFAGQDLIQSGYEAADYLAQLLGGKGDVIIVSVDAAGQWSIDRETGARNALANYPDINVVQTVNAGTEPQEMYANVENALLANPNVVGVVSLDCCTVQSAAEYVKRNNLKDQILMVGFDEVPAAMQLIKEGYIAATFSQAPERQTYESVKMLLDFLHGEPISTVDTGIARIDLTNVDEYMPQEQTDPADTKREGHGTVSPASSGLVRK